MKKKRKIILSFLICLFFFSAILVPSMKVNATQSVSDKFNPATLTGNPATDMVAIATAQANRNAGSLGYREAWCADFVSDCAKYIGQSEAVPFNGGVTSLYNAVIKAGGQRVNTPQAGDLLFYYCNPEGGFVHVGIMKSSTMSIQGNVNGIVYDNLIPSYFNDSQGHKMGNGLTAIYVRPNYRQGISPVIAFDAAYEDGEGMVTVTGWAYDGDDVNANLSIHVYEFRDGQSYFIGATTANIWRPDVNDAFGCGNYHGFAATFPSTLGGSVEINVAAINIGSGDHSWANSKTINITQDSQAPAISNVQVTDISNEGYTVTCNVSDNVGIKKIEFPTWTVADSQDDLIWHAGTITDGVATCRILSSDHGNQIEQDYITHIYAWDYMGNQVYADNDMCPCLYVKVTDNVTVTAIHYKEKLDGSYSKAAEVTYQRKPGTKITPGTKNYTGFTAPEKKKVTVKADGSTVVKYYYTRNSYKLTWNFAGGKASGTYTKGSVKYGDTITAPTPKRDGYTFNGWDIEVPKKMPAEDVTIKAKWKAKTNTPYTVEHYKQKVDGTYSSTASESESFTGKTNTSVTPEVKTYKGFTSPEVVSAKIKGDGTLVIKYYYTRNSYKLTWDFAGGSAKGSYTKGNVKYGAKITAPVPTRDGYKFTGWDKTVAEKMPAKNVTYTATWRKLTQEELVEAFVERFYVIILDRPAESKGLNDWTNSLLSKKKTGADVAAGFINSQEFQSKKMSDEEYLNKLYLAFFDREPDKAGYDSWMRELKNGKSRDYVLGGFINSTEFNNLCKKYGIRTGGY